MQYFELEKSELKAIIEGRRVYRRCSACRDGTEFITDDGQLIPPTELSKYKESEYYTADCEDCKGLGYVISIHE